MWDDRVYVNLRDKSNEQQYSDRQHYALGPVSCLLRLLLNAGAACTTETARTEAQAADEHSNCEPQAKQQHDHHTDVVKCYLY